MSYYIPPSKEDLLKEYDDVLKAVECPTEQDIIYMVEFSVEQKNYSMAVSVIQNKIKSYNQLITKINQLEDMLDKVPFKKDMN